MAYSSFGKLFNVNGELIAEGNCEVDAERGTVSFHPVYDNPELGRQTGAIRLDLDDGGSLLLSDHVIRYRLNAPGVPPGWVYRLFLAGMSAEQTASGGGQ